MLHAKFQDHRLPALKKKISKGFYHIWAWRPLGHVTWTIYINFHSPFPRRLHIKFGLIDQAVSEEKKFEIVNGQR